MTTPAEQEEDRRRRGLLVLFLLVGVLLGLLAGIGLSARGADVMPSASGPRVRPSPSGAPDATVVLPGSAQPATGATAFPAAATASGHAISVSGVIRAVVGPGSPATLVVTVVNPGGQAVVVTSVRGRVSAVEGGNQAGKPTCQASWYHVGSFSGSRRLARHSRTSVELQVTFDDAPTVNQDNCKGARYRFAFVATARSA